MKIGVMDSGIGGMTVLEEVRKLLPNYDYIYYGDSKNNPYGNKSDDELLSIASSIVTFLINQGCKLIIIACNTATTRCREKLMKLFPNIIFIGVVPAIKVACDKNYKNVLVMATPSTIKSERVHDLIKENKKIYQNIYLLSCEGLANAIENNNVDLIDRLLLEFLTPYLDKSIDSIVLGCTHYPLIKKNIKSLIKNVDILDGNIGVAKETKRQLDNNGFICNDFGSLKIYNSLIYNVL